MGPTVKIGGLYQFGDGMMISQSYGHHQNLALYGIKKIHRMFSYVHTLYSYTK